MISVDETGTECTSAHVKANARRPHSSDDHRSVSSVERSLLPEALSAQIEWHDAVEQLDQLNADLTMKGARAFRLILHHMNLQSLDSMVGRIIEISLWRILLIKRFNVAANVFCIRLFVAQIMITNGRCRFE